MEEPADTSLRELTARLAAFASDREWEQFHTPKNLAMAVAGEAGELVAELQWARDDESLGEDVRQRVSEEAADVLIYLLRLADVLDVDLLDVAWRKVEINEERYPAHLVLGSAEKRGRAE